MGRPSNIVHSKILAPSISYHRAGHTWPSLNSDGSEGGMKEGGVYEISPNTVEYILRIL